MVGVKALEKRYFFPLLYISTVSAPSHNDVISHSLDWVIDLMTLGLNDMVFIDHPRDRTLGFTRCLI